jgi:hypothetical protein
MGNLKQTTMNKTLPLLLLLLISCSTPRNTLDPGRYIESASKTLDSTPINPVQYRINGFDLYFSVNAILDILKNGERSLLAVQSIKFIEDNISNRNSHLTKSGQSLVLNNTLSIKYITNYDIEYAMDRLFKSGEVYVEESGSRIDKILHKKWQPKIQGTIISQWISKDNKIINEFQEGFVD